MIDQEDLSEAAEHYEAGKSDGYEAALEAVLERLSEEHEEAEFSDEEAGLYDAVCIVQEMLSERQ